MINPGVTVEMLNQMNSNTMMEHLGIVYTEVGSDFLKATMPVDNRTVQPFRLLHGGASVALAETLGSMAANFCVDHTKKMCVGLEINANHIRSVREGIVTGTAKPVHIGKNTHVWEIRITNDKDELVCVSRLTMAVLEKGNI